MAGRGDAPVKVVHFADPWCWWSWGLEPVIRRLEEVYGDKLEVQYRMGGTFEDVDAWMREYGVDEASTVDWIRESNEMTRNPVDPAYIRKTGVRSTYPACRAYKAAELQGGHRAQKFLRRMMEAFQIRAEAETQERLLHLAREVGLDADRLGRDMKSKEVEEAFEEDRRAMEKEGVNFLSLLISTSEGREVKGEVFTSGPFEAIIDRRTPGLPKRSPVDILEYFEKYQDLTPVHEIAEVFRISDEDAEDRLSALEGEGLLRRRAFAEGKFWTMGEIKLDKLPLNVVRISHVPSEARVEATSDLTPIVTNAVQQLYTQVAQQPDRPYHFPLGLEALLFVGYPKADLEKLPPTALES